MNLSFAVKTRCIKSINGRWCVGKQILMRLITQQHLIAHAAYSLFRAVVLHVLTQYYCIGKCSISSRSKQAIYLEQVSYHIFLFPKNETR